LLCKGCRFLQFGNLNKISRAVSFRLFDPTGERIADLARYRCFEGEE
jgi:hypothetical protein